MSNRADRLLPGPLPCKATSRGLLPCPWISGARGGGAVISARAGAELVANRPHGVGTTESGTGLSLSGKNTVAAVAGALLLSEIDQTFECPLISMISRLDCLFIQ